MPRLPSRLTLVLVALVFLSPTLATAFPQGADLRSASERPEAAPGLFSRIWGLLSAVWATGSVLEPDGASAASGTEPSDATDTGSILDPNG